VEAGASHQITERQIKVRQVTHFQPTWTEHAAGEPGTFTIQLILDHGAEEYVLRPPADDADVLLQLLDSGKETYFDLERSVLMFGNRAVG
jgi:hypothetical protein